LTIFFGALSFFLLPRSIDEARFFSDEEKQALKVKLTEDAIIAKDSEHDKINLKNVLTTFTRPHVVFMCLACFFGGSTESGLA
jgi:hypothetical protein